MKAIRVLAIVLFASPSVLGITIDMVTVGNPGNANDSLFSSLAIGGVDHIYKIGKYEVTAGQYTAFLNAVAKSDPNGLYNSNMVSNVYGAQIQQIGVSPNFSYWVPADGANRPVNYVSFLDAARFANWLHNGQPTGAQDFGTTEDGAYRIVQDQVSARRPGAKFFLPTQSEWYKAAFHKNDGVTNHYWRYTTASDTLPSNTLPDPGNHANFYTGSFAIGSPYYRTEVGAYTNSASPYGTFDQGGNVSEWNETPDPVLSARGYFGGSFYPSDLPSSSSRGISDPRNQFFYMGFRVASVPEPSTLLLTVAAFAPSFAYRRRTARDRD